MLSALVMCMDAVNVKVLSLYIKSFFRRISLSVEDFNICMAVLCSFCSVCYLFELYTFCFFHIFKNPSIIFIYSLDQMLFYSFSLVFYLLLLILSPSPYRYASGML